LIGIREFTFTSNDIKAIPEDGFFVYNIPFSLVFLIKAESRRSQTFYKCRLTLKFLSTFLLQVHQAGATIDATRRGIARALGNSTGLKDVRIIGDGFDETIRNINDISDSQ